MRPANNTKHKQQELAFKTWGGKRKGAGRPPRAKRSSEPHKARPDLKPGQAVHVTLRALTDVANLRRAGSYHAIRNALYTVLPRCDFRIVHISIQSNHVHLIAEADSKQALARGVQGFEISAAKGINAATSESGAKRAGSVFSDRYHQRVLSSPRQVRNAIAYVLNNWRRHGEDRRVPSRLVDPYSNGVSFGGWTELDDSPVLYSVPEKYDRLSVSFPQTWLLRAGWQKAGPISVRYVPGPDAKRDVT